MLVPTTQNRKNIWENWPALSSESGVKTSV
jgi:hypothetical protein